MLIPVLNVEQIRKWDEFTIENEPISSYLLMERAANRIAQFIIHNFSDKHQVFILAGSGNNGGDGVAVARILAEKNYIVALHIVSFSSWSPDTKKNIQKLPQNINEIEHINDFEFDKNTIVIDALFGSGLTRKIEGEYAEKVLTINTKSGIKIAIDTPSGLFSDTYNAADVIFKANFTITLQAPKISMSDSNSIDHTGRVFVLPIGLHEDYIKSISAKKFWFLQHNISINKRKLSGHKGTFGFVSVVGGSSQTPGAPILASRAAMVAGAGYVALGMPNKFSSFLGVQYPELMQLQVEGDEHLKNVCIHEKTNVLLLGPGLGVNEDTKRLVNDILKHPPQNTVIDADGLNTLAKYELTPPKGAVLTPHIGEMSRLIGKNEVDITEFEAKTMNYAITNEVTIVLKNANTTVFSPDGQIYKHLGGNDALAKGGSGDVLAGLISGMLAQKNDVLWACNNAVEIHKHAAHLYCKEYASHSLTPQKLIEMIGKSIKSLS